MEREGRALDPRRESQPERTGLAWRRTSLALAATALLTIAVVVHRGSTPASLAVLGLAVAVALTGLGVAERRVRALASPVVGRIGRTPAMLALVVVTLGALGAAIVLILP